MAAPSLETRLAEWGGVRAGSRQEEALAQLGCRTCGDLLMHYPRRYEDRRRFSSFPDGPVEEPLALRAIIVDTRTRRGRGRRGFFEIDVEDLAAPEGMRSRLSCRWFHMPWMSRQLAAGQELVLHGRIKRSGRRLVIDHPEHEVVDPSHGDASIHLGRIVPVYPATGGIQPRQIRELMHQLLAELPEIPDLVPPGHGGWPAGSRDRALRDIHFPGEEEARAAARRFLAREELVAIQLNVVRERRRREGLPGTARVSHGRLWQRFLDTLPFTLTGAQARAVEETRADLASTRPMNRLLQGDVGSGKTLVAVAAMLDAVEAGWQAALMAPTQILAEQHYLTLHRWLEPLGLRVSLRTGQRQEDGYLPLLAGGSDQPQIIIGTHALIHDKVAFERLGVAVVDEQHKFGVLQRARLMERGDAPDVLVMTATPIPRTLTMTVYGDLDVSVLDELPGGRGAISTGVRPASKTPEAAAFLREQIDAGRQAYVVYPLIEDSEKLKAQAATVEFRAWEERLPGIRCELLHGRLAAEDKEAIMTRFRAGEAQVLVATTVIEVGIDVPNANIMLIYNAERFGLAQLHQLRGRIGRGSHRSWCILMHGPVEEPAALEKLHILASTRDGFRIAEEDLRLRGPGDVLGTAQSGLPGLRLADLTADTRLLREARDVAERILAADPDLQAPAHRALRALLVPAGQTLSQVS